ncbi:MAG TPA: phosphatase PAP2 family protein [Acidimicrobiales bacterium]
MSAGEAPSNGRNGGVSGWHVPWVKVLLLVLAWACLTGILIGVGEWVTHTSPVNAFDRHVTSIVVAHRIPALDSAMKVVTWLGSWVALVATAILLVVLVLLRRLALATLFVAAVAWAGESGGVALAKQIVQRSRPPAEIRLVSAHGWSWPSGHTAVAIVIFTTLALVVTGTVSGAAPRAFVWVLAALAVGAVAFSRIELGVHWTTDVIASTLFVVVWLIVLWNVSKSEIHPARLGTQETGGGVE